MFEELDGVPWSSLSCCCGSASHVPADVRALVSEDLQTVQAAYWKLDNHVVCQGDLYESAAYLPAVLVEVLSVAKHKKPVLDLLFEIGNGYHPDANIRECCFRGVMDGLQRWLEGALDASAELKETVGRLIEELIECAATEEPNQTMEPTR